MSSIKETLEVLEGLKVLCSDAKQVLSDGKVDIADLPVVMSLLTQLGTLSAAVQGVADVPTEIKELTTDEIAVLVAKVLEIVAVFKG